MSQTSTPKISLKEKINTNDLPQHIAVIMDGNGRWAKSKGKFRVFGHQHGVKSVREVTEACAELGVEFLTLYAFSTENWNRPKAEVMALMELLVHTIRKELKTLQDNNIKLNAIGHVENLPPKCLRELQEAIQATQQNTRMTLTLALSYGSRSEIVDATKKIAQDVAAGKLEVSAINDNIFQSYLYTYNLPDPSLLIRTSGEQRISNFMLWQLAYTEFYFSPLFWPDFQREELYQAIIAFQERERRFGKTSEQVKA
jgi:undecaprenyl diphosphate synthase